MTPAQRLLAAAALLDKRAGEATEGPWRARTWEDDGDSFADVVGKSEAEQYSGSYTVTTALVTGGPTEVTEPGWLAPINARYIATMHPGIGKEQAAWLRDSADDLIDTPGTWTQHTLCARFIGHPDPTNRCRHYDRALGIADLILAGES